MRQVKTIFILAIVFISAGTVLTLENIHILSGASRVWPGFLLIVGAGFFMLFFERKGDDAVLLFLGTAMSLLGLFFFYLNYSTWTRMATLWPLFLGIAGTSFFSIYFCNRDRFFLFIALALIMLAALFLIVFGVSLHLWPLSLVAFGVSLLFVNHFRIKK
jgi:hypothetical protein